MKREMGRFCRTERQEAGEGAREVRGEGDGEKPGAGGRVP
jgi:hypothetical protein